MIDATFWVAVSFFIFIGILIYFKIPSKIKISLDDNILEIKKQIEEPEKLTTAVTYLNTNIQNLKSIVNTIK